MDYSKLFLEKYNEGSNEGSLLFKCKDKNLTCHKDFFSFVCDLLKVDPPKYDGAEYRGIEYVFDLSIYPNISVNYVLKHCYSPYIPLPNELTFENILEIITLREYFLFHDKTIDTLINALLGKITDTNYLQTLAITEKYKDITTNKTIKFTGDINSIIYDNIYHYVAKYIRRQVDLNSIENIVTLFSNYNDDKTINGIYLISLLCYYKPDSNSKSSYHISSNYW